MTNTGRGKTFVITAVTAAVAAMSAGVWAYSHSSKSARPSGDPMELFEKARAASSQPGVTDEQRRKLFDEAREAADARIDEHVNAYYAAKSPEDKQSVLDRNIDEFEQRRREFESRRRDDPPGSQPASQPSRDWRRRRGPSTPAERKTRSETRSPDSQVRRMAYFDAMRKRMQERGIQPPRSGGPGGRGGPGGGGPGGFGRGGRDG